MKQPKDMTTVDMVAEYNKLTGKTIKKFATRADGERQLKAARDAHELIHSLIGEPTEKEKKQIKKNQAALQAKKQAEHDKKKAKRGVPDVAPPNVKVNYPPFKRPVAKRSIRSAIIEYVMEGKDNATILVLVRKEFGSAKVPASYPGWYRAQLRRNGTITY